MIPFRQISRLTRLSLCRCKNCFHRPTTLGLHQEHFKGIPVSFANDVHTNSVAGLEDDPYIGPLRRYSLLLQRGILRPDHQQFFAVNKLQELHNRIKDYQPSCSTFRPQILDEIGIATEFQASSADNKVPSSIIQNVPKGLYMHGGVGSGKTLLLDLFYDGIQIKQKKRVHFHAFMVYLYSEMNRWNLCCDGDDDTADLLTPTEAIARRILQDAWLICFDEIQLSDYGASSLLNAVFKHMINHGAVIVSTSNRPPDNLGDSSLTEMHDGEVGEVATESVASFKRLLKEQCDVFKLETEVDYRDKVKPGQKTYYYPIIPRNEEMLDAAFADRVSAGKSIGSSYLEVYGREILVPISSNNGVARFTFKELFCTPKGPADYIQICNSFPTVFVDCIPKMSIEMKNEARRFLSFIDAAYESRTKLFCTADAPPEELFSLLPKSDGNLPDTMEMEMIGELAYDLELHNLDVSTLGFISGEDEIFSFKRAISRLKEMQGYLYQMAPHRTQIFSPYRGSKVEKKDAVKKRWVREMRRRKKLQEFEAEKENETNTEDTSAESPLNRRPVNFKETDWGDEASFNTWSEDIVYKENQRQSKLYKRQANAPKLGEQHFWGFGWWENAIKRIKTEKFAKWNDDDKK